MNCRSPILTLPYYHDIPKHKKILLWCWVYQKWIEPATKGSIQKQLDHKMIQGPKSCQVSFLCLMNFSHTQFLDSNDYTIKDTITEVSVWRNLVKNSTTRVEAKLMMGKSRTQTWHIMWLKIFQTPWSLFSCPENVVTINMLLAVRNT